MTSISSRGLKGRPPPMPIVPSILSSWGWMADNPLKTSKTVQVAPSFPPQVVPPGDHPKSLSKTGMIGWSFWADPSRLRTAILVQWLKQNAGRGRLIGRCGAPAKWQ